MISGCPWDIYFQAVPVMTVSFMPPMIELLIIAVELKLIRDAFKDLVLLLQFSTPSRDFPDQNPQNIVYS